MRRRILLIGCALAAGLYSVSAQQAANGRVILAPYFNHEYRLMFSQNDYIYGTSRTAAMGGAFTSLGADLSSMNINPAGLGMYQSSDWGITQSLSINGMDTSAGNMGMGSFASGGNRVSYGLNNLAVAYNIFNRSNGLTSLTLGFGYNRAANFNSRSYISTGGENTSIAEIFQRQLQLMHDDVNNPIKPGALSPSSYPFRNNNIFLDEWGAVLGYQTGLVTHNGGIYSALGGLTPADSYFQSIAKGGIYDYSVSLGANVNNILYLGATLGISQINYKENATYEESYTNASIRGMWYDQNTHITGSGFTMKLGAVVRPFPALRIGAAFHLPTYYSIDKSYRSYMNIGERTFSPDKLVDQLDFDTAPKVLVGVSYVIADKAILSVDYERTWYNKVRERSDYAIDVDNSKAKSAELYNPANTIRAGLEVLLSDIVSLRAGGGYQMDFMKDRDPLADLLPTMRSYYTVSGGLGFNIGQHAYIDATYIFNRAKYTSYDLFSFIESDTNYAYQNDGSPQRLARYYTPRKDQHMITLTIGSRF